MVRQTIWAAEKIQTGSRGVLGWGVVLISAGGPGGRQAGKAAGHPFARAGVMEFAVLRSTESIRKARPRQVPFPPGCGCRLRGS